MNRVALIGENSVKYIKILIDIWNSGDSAVLIDYRIPFATAVNMMKEAGVTTCYLENNVYKVQGCFGIKFVIFEHVSNSPQLLTADIYNSFKENYSQNEAVVLYSSGTTGKSRGIILSHFALNTNADAIIDYMRPTKDDCIYIAKGLYHSSTLTGELLVSLKAKIKLVISPTIVPPRYILKNIIKFNVSIICLNPILLQIFIQEYKTGKYIIKKLKTIYVSGSILNDKVCKEARSVLKNILIYNVYGLTEAGPRVAAQCNSCFKNNSVGKPIKNVKVIIVDETGKQVKQNEKGIIHVSTPSLFTGYISGGSKQKSLYMNWLNTGDIGYFDKNEDLHIVDRVDDIIILDSHKIYPSEIESVILANSEIEQCTVTKIELSNKEYICCAYCGKKEDIILLKKKLLQFLISYEVPRYWINCKNIPSTNNGKYIKSEIKKLFTKDSSKQVDVI